MQNGSPHFHALIDEMRKIHDSKNHDYAQESDRFSNFHRAAIIVSWFNQPIDQVFAAVIGIKITRLAELLNGKTPNNESLADNGLDLANYTALWEAERRDRIAREVKVIKEALGMIPIEKYGPSGGQKFVPDGPNNQR